MTHVNETLDGVKITVSLERFSEQKFAEWPHLNVHIESDLGTDTYSWKWRKNWNLVHVPEIFLDKIKPGGMMTIEEEPFARGGFGAVYKGLTNTGLTVAVKKPFVKPGSTLEDMAFTYFEALLTKSFEHENIVTLIAMVQPNNSNSRPWLIFEYMENGSLWKILQDAESPLKENDELKSRISKDIAAGMKYLHSNMCIHRDLTPKNILLNNDFRAKITDFGLSSFLDNKNSSYKMCSKTVYSNDGRGKYKITGQTSLRLAYQLFYSAPEVLPVHQQEVELSGEMVLLDPEGQFHFKSDVWSFGVVLHQIWTDASHGPYSNTSQDPSVDVPRWLKSR